jgi:hypothetical protein
MSQTYGREVPLPHQQASHRPHTRYLVIVATPGGSIAKLLLKDRRPVAELDACTEEVAGLMVGRTATVGAQGSEWDPALAGCTPEERAQAQVYTLDP